MLRLIVFLTNDRAVAHRGIDAARVPASRSEHVRAKVVVDWIQGGFDPLGYLQ